eukprot:3466192-Pyramimonas_sp.AAC.1
MSLVAVALLQHPPRVAEKTTKPTKSTVYLAAAPLGPEGTGHDPDCRGLDTRLGTPRWNITRFVMANGRE